jgi:hypothetical protein
MDSNTKETTNDPTRTRLIHLMQHPQEILRKPKHSLNSLLARSLAKSLAFLEDTRRRLHADISPATSDQPLNPKSARNRGEGSKPGYTCIAPASFSWLIENTPPATPSHSPRATPSLLGSGAPCSKLSGRIMAACTPPKYMPVSPGVGGRLILTW